MCTVAVMSRHEVFGIEKAGFFEGAIFVLSLGGVADWTTALEQPKSTASRRTRSTAAAADPFDHVTVKALYKGFKPWRVRGLRYDAR